MDGGVIQRSMAPLLHPFIGSCDETRDRFSEHLEGTLTGAKERRMRRHLRRCRRCRGLYESFLRTVESLRALGRSDADGHEQSLAQAVAAQIRAESLRPDDA